MWKKHDYYLSQVLKDDYIEYGKVSNMWEDEEQATMMWLSWVFSFDFVEVFGVDLYGGPNLS